MEVLVTGGAGFIGSHLVEALLARGDRVVVVDNFNDFYSPVQKRLNLKAVSGSPRLAIHALDLRGREDLAKLFSQYRFDGVVHLAAWAGVRPSVERPLTYVENNVSGTQALLDACAVAKVSRVIFASSSSVYGNDSPRPSREEFGADRPLSPYAATKRAGELLCHAAHHIHGLHVSCMRLFTAVGPRQRPDLALHKFTKRIGRGEPITLFGDGSSERDYTYVLDIVDGFIRALDRANGYRLYNLGAGRPVRLLEVVATIGKALGVEPKVEFAPPQPGDVEATLADIARARAELGYAPSTSFAEAVERFVQWTRSTEAHVS